MLVSCICPTYGRCPHKQWLLEEAIECFLRQCLPEGVTAELIVLNDHPEQTLTYETPILQDREVRVVNQTERWPSLGAKYNEMVRLTRGEIILPWEDDDLSLPCRITDTINHLGSHSYWNPHRIWFWPTSSSLPYVENGGICHHACAFRKSAWESAGKYPESRIPPDMAFDISLKSLGSTALPLSPSERPSYIYRWGVSDFHFSACPPYDQSWQKYGARPVTPGTFVLRPHWKQAYDALCK